MGWWLRSVVRMNRNLSNLKSSILPCVLGHFYATSRILKVCAALHSVFSVFKLETRSEKATLLSQKHITRAGSPCPGTAVARVFLVAFCMGKSVAMSSKTRMSSTLLGDNHKRLKIKQSTADCSS